MSRRSPFEVLSLELFAHMSEITGEGKSSRISWTGPLPAPSSECEYDFTVKTFLEDTIFSLNGIWYPYLTKQYAIFSISRTGSEFHVQLPFLYEGYSRYSVPLTGSSEEHTSRHVDRLCTTSTAFLSMRHNTACFVSSLPQV
jgi:hypothetical protein